MHEQAFGEVLDLVYDAAVTPDLWPAALERLADALGGVGGILMQQNQRDRTGSGLISRLDARVPQLYFSRFARLHPTQRWTDNPRERIRHFIPRITTDDDAMEKAQLMRTEFYNDFMRPFDMHSILRVGLGAQGVDAAFLNISRPQARGAFTAEDMELAARLHPHLIRAFKLDRVLAASREARDDMAGLLDHAPYAVFLLDDVGQVRHANRAAEALLARGRACGLAVAGGRLTAASPEAAGRLQALIAAAADPQADRRAGGSLSIAVRDQALPLSLVVAPIRDRRISLFHRGPGVIVCVTDLAADRPVPRQRLRELFGLTGAEADVALALFDGAAPREAAGRLGVSVNTVRVHLARLFDKTGTHRQAELMRLIARATEVGPG